MLGIGGKNVLANVLLLSSLVLALCCCPLGLHDFSWNASKAAIIWFCVGVFVGYPYIGHGGAF